MNKKYNGHFSVSFPVSESYSIRMIIHKALVQIRTSNSFTTDLVHHYLLKYALSLNIVIEELNNWSKSYVNELKSSLTKEVQWIAFTLVKLSKISNVVKLFNETFRLYEKSDLFLSTIHQMLLRKEYKEVIILEKYSIFIYF